jgi:hypothetical protein
VGRSFANCRGDFRLCGGCTAQYIRNMGAGGQRSETDGVPVLLDLDKLGREIRGFAPATPSKESATPAVVAQASEPPPIDRETEAKSIALEYAASVTPMPSVGPPLLAGLAAVFIVLPIASVVLWAMIELSTRGRGQGTFLALGVILTLTFIITVSWNTYRQHQHRRAFQDKYDHLRLGGEPDRSSWTYEARRRRENRHLVIIRAILITIGGFFSVLFLQGFLRTGTVPIVGILAFAFVILLISGFWGRKWR